MAPVRTNLELVDPADLRSPDSAKSSAPARPRTMSRPRHSEASSAQPSASRAGWLNPGSPLRQSAQHPNGRWHDAPSVGAVRSSARGVAMRRHEAGLRLPADGRVLASFSSGRPQGLPRFSQRRVDRLSVRGWLRVRRGDQRSVAGSPTSLRRRPGSLPLRVCPARPR
jgi:hypothetical protein